MNNNEIIARIRERMMQLRITQKELAVMIGITPTQLSRNLKSGKFKEETINKIMNKLNLKYEIRNDTELMLSEKQEEYKITFSKENIIRMIEKIGRLEAYNEILEAENKALKAKLEIRESPKEY